MKSADFGKYVQSKLYPHIEPNNLFATKIAFMKTFYRSDLATRGWSKLTTTQNTPLAQSKIDVSRDSILIVVKDNSKVLRDTLSEDEVAKYTDQKYRDHLRLKTANARKDVVAASAKYDPLLDAAQRR